MSMVKSCLGITVISYFLFFFKWKALIHFLLLAVTHSLPDLTAYLECIKTTWWTLHINAEGMNCEHSCVSLPLFIYMFWHWHHFSCWLECIIEPCSVQALVLNLKCETSVQKSTMSGVSCLPPRSPHALYPLFALLFLLYTPLLLWWAAAVGVQLWSIGLTAVCQNPSPHAKMHRSCLAAVGPTYL